MVLQLWSVGHTGKYCRTKFETLEVTTKGEEEGERPEYSRERQGGDEEQQLCAISRKEPGGSGKEDQDCLPDLLGSESGSGTGWTIAVKKRKGLTKRKFGPLCRVGCACHSEGQEKVVAREHGTQTGRTTTGYTQHNARQSGNWKVGSNTSHSRLRSHGHSRSQKGRRAVRFEGNS